MMESVDDTLGQFETAPVEAVILEIAEAETIQFAQYPCDSGCRDYCECEGYGCELYD